MRIALFQRCGSCLGVFRHPPPLSDLLTGSIRRLPIRAPDRAPSKRVYWLGRRKTGFSVMSLAVLAEDDSHLLPDFIHDLHQ